jgi:hypothetical protein
VQVGNDRGNARWIAWTVKSGCLLTTAAQGKNMPHRPTRSNFSCSPQGTPPPQFKRGGKYESTKVGFTLEAKYHC